MACSELLRFPFGCVLHRNGAFKLGMFHEGILYLCAFVRGVCRVNRLCRNRIAFHISDETAPFCNTEAAKPETDTLEFL